jgi:hypothetical protein
MPLSDTFQQLDGHIRSTVEKTVADLRREFLERLQTHYQQLREHLDGLTPDLPETLLPAEQLDAAVREAATAAASEAGSRERGDALRGLKAALARLDAASGQSEVLAALLEEAGRFASRTAILLVAPGGLRGWGGQGFGDAEGALRGFRVEAGEGSDAARLLEGRGSVEVGSAGRARLSSRLEVPVAHRAVLIPLVLRDRIAAALYADRPDDEAPLAVDALQILTHAAAAALETLPLRRRPFNPTLRSTDEIDPDRPGLPLWETATEAVETVTEAAPQAAREATPPAAATAVVEAAEGAEEEEIELGGFEEELEVEEPGPGEPLDREGLTTLELEEPPRQAAAEEAGGEEVAEAEEAEAGEGWETSGERLSWKLEEEPEAETGGAGGVEEAATPSAGAPPPPEPPGGPLRTLRIASTEAPPTAPLAEDDTRPGVDTGPGGAAPIQPQAGAAGAMVEPPSDVEGPGWAFAGNEERGGDEEADHQKAQRLARLLVSEIKLYNEEQVQEGRRNHDICERLKEDIERSRQLYESRVEERVRETTDYFYQEMVRVLGAGDPKTLGI